MLYQSKIIVSQINKKEYLISLLNLDHLDLEVEIIDNEDSTIGIKEVSLLSEKSSKRSSGLKLFLILNSEKLTVEAQNSLLKLLEEPNHNSLFVLHAINPDLLLDTIKSRCEVIVDNKINEDLKLSNIEFVFKDFLGLTYLEKTKVVETFLKDSNKDKIKKAIIVILNQIAKEEEFIDQLSRIEKAYKAVDKNVNPKLIFEYLIISLQK